MQDRGWCGGKDMHERFFDGVGGVKGRGRGGGGGC